MVDPCRRTLIKTALAVGASAWVKPLSANAATSLLVTPDEIEGPFYPSHQQADKDFDLTQIAGREGVAKGRPVTIQGRVLDVSGRPLANTIVDLWQANAAGRYRHPFDRTRVPLDENFQGWGVVTTDNQGRFRVKTIMPGAYYVSDVWQRPPHIHFKISKPDYRSITTQMYFQDHPLNRDDLLINAKPPALQELMIAKLIDDNNVYNYQIVMHRS